MNQQLEDLLSERKELESRKSKLKDTFWFRRARIKGVDQLLRKNHKSLIEETHDYLLETNGPYSRLVERNLLLLTRSKIRFKPYEYGLAKFTEVFEGKLSSNGHVYLESYVNNTTKNWKSAPMRLEGTIDHYGRVQLKLVKTQAVLWDSLPKYYEGSISKTGEISLDAPEHGDGLMSGSMNIEKMIAQLFEKDSKYLEEFEKNATLIRALNWRFRDTLEERLQKQQ